MGMKHALETISSSINGPVSEGEHPYGVLRSKITETVLHIHHVHLWDVQGILHFTLEQRIRHNCAEINNLMKPVYMPKNLQIENSKGLNRIKEQYNYNSYKNLVYKYTGGTGLINKTVYIWSYKGEYPIAEIKNATYDEVKNALSELLIYRVTNVLIPEENDLKAINNLRTTLPNALVTTYTYKPLIGITSATDPRGITTYYEYDCSGRLKTVYIGEKDNNGNEKKRVLNTYDYHYGGQ